MEMLQEEEYFDLLFAREVGPNHIAELILSKLQIIPNKLYRYRPINDYLKDTLMNDIAFLSSADKFNDPYDSGLTVDYNEIHLNKIKDNVLSDFCKEIHYLYPNQSFESFYTMVKNITKDVPIKYLGDMLGNTLKQEENTNLKSKINYIIEKTYDVYEDYIKSLNDIYQSTIYTACFSETNDNILMWSHYAQYHKGICIEYDFSNIDYTSRTLLTLSPVKYTNELFDMNNYPNRTPIDRIQLAALSKFECWKYENEWRLISFLKEEQKFKLDKPTAVIFGTKTSKEDKAWISDLCAERDIPIKQANLDRTEYKLHIK
ncbi:DUF2971 domain-containing protein [Sporosarcina sp. SG10008]|uniref:DUF2971 domain-containing protein n=1 Tax=Sporosarcina sp. SG10008 TaxID=3373103 RepID=UPI0037DC4E37